MQIKEIQKTDIPHVSHSTTSKNAPLCDAVKASQSGIAQVQLDQNQKLASVRSSLQGYVKLHEPTLTVFSRGDKLFVAKKTAVDWKPRATKVAKSGGPVDGAAQVNK